MLKGLKHIENLLPQDHRATLAVTGRLDGTTEDEVQSDIIGHGFRILSSAVHYDRDEGSSGALL